MIQRIQTLYLVIVLLLSVVLFLVPVYSMETLAVLNSSTPTGLQQFTVLSNIVYLVLNSVAAVFALVSIFLYKNRTLQIRLCNLNMLIICIFIATIFYFADHSKTNPDAMVHYEIGCYFPLIQLVFTFLAMRAIRKDDELVRSADRLR